MADSAHDYNSDGNTDPVNQDPNNNNADPANTDQNQGDGGGTDPSQQTVSRAEFDKVMSELHKYKKQAKDYEQQLKAKEDEDLKKREEWKTLAEKRQEEVQKEKERADNLHEAYVRDRKNAALRDAAMKAGIRKEALEDLDLLEFDEVSVEPNSSGGLRVNGADQAIANLKTMKPHWFRKSGSNVNASGPEVVDSKEVTLDDVMKAEEKAKKSGDYAPYQKLLRQYQQQQQR